MDKIIGKLDAEIHYMLNPKDCQLVHISRLKTYFRNDLEDEKENCKSGFYEIKAILDSWIMKKKEKKQYLVKYKGWMNKYNQWKNEEDL